jgi:hypothetical protein
MIAARLVALLPRVTFISASSRGTEVGVTAANSQRGFIYVLFFGVAIAVLAIGAQSIVGGHQPSGRVDRAFSDVSGARSSSALTERVEH